jgi:autophagy-related protein 27
MKPEFSALSSEKGLSLILHGSSYPTVGSHDPEEQSLNVTLLCSSGDASEPIFKDYDGKQVQVEWTAPAGCEVTGGGDSGDGGGNDQDAEHVGSGIGWFFLV